MRKIIAALFVAALTVLSLSSSAQAASSVTVSGSCTILGDNTHVDISVHWTDTSGSPSRGTLQYIVYSSTRPLSYGVYDGGNQSFAEAIKPNRLVSLPYISFGYLGLTNGKYVYRSSPVSADLGRPDISSVNAVPVRAAAGNGNTDCHATIHPHN